MHEKRFFEAVKNGDYNTVEGMITGKLINNVYMNVNLIEEGEEDTPLTYAIARTTSASDNNFGKIAGLLIKYGADVNTCNKLGMSPLALAKQQKAIGLIKELEIRNAQSLHNKRFFKAVTENDLKIVEGMITGKLIDCEYMNVNLIEEGEEDTPLTYAIARTNSASDNDFGKIAKLLIIHGANVNICNKLGMSPLALAKQQKAIGLIKELEIRNAQSLHNKRFFKVVTENDVEIVEGMISGALIDCEYMNVNLIEDGQDTPLTYAIAHNFKDIALCLINRGADVNACNQQGFSPLDLSDILQLCGIPGMSQIVTTLRERGAKYAKFTSKDKENLEATLISQKVELNASPSLLKQFDMTKKKTMSKRPEELLKHSQSMITLAPILEHPAIKGEVLATGELTSAHKYTSTEIRNQLPVLIKMDNDFKLSDPNLSVETVHKEALEVAQVIGIDNPILDNMKKTLALVLQNSPIESGETHANVRELLSRTWTLAKSWDEKQSVINANNARGEIIDLLHLNIADGGSCIPGLVARLYPAYAKLINYTLQQQSSETYVYNTKQRF